MVHSGRFDGHPAATASDDIVDWLAKDGKAARRSPTGCVTG